MLKDEKLKIFKQALSRLLKNIAKGKSATTIAASYGIPPSIISNIFKGEKDPQISTFYRLAEAFNINPSELTDMIFKELPENFMFAEE